MNVFLVIFYWIIASLGFGIGLTMGHPWIGAAISIGAILLFQFLVFIGQLLLFWFLIRQMKK